MDRIPRDPLGFAPERSPSVLLLIDTINDFNFPKGKQLAKHAIPAARRIAALKSRLKKKGVPAVYVNDNFGRWRSDFRSQVDHCLREEMPGEPVARLLIPNEDDYFVLKPKHSAFYSTSLEVLLNYLGARKVIITGFATNLCVLYTANDAYMRDYSLVVPADCVAAESVAAHRAALKHMKEQLGADTRVSTLLRVARRGARARD